MFSILTAVALTQPQHIPPAPSSILRQTYPIHPLAGQLDKTPVFNSNSPEVVMGEGILLSTLNPQGKAVPAAHLNYTFSGRFDLFAHHITRLGKRPNEVGRQLYIGMLVFNPGSTPVTVKILQGLSYTTSPDAPFITLPPLVENPDGRIFSGPGSRLAADIQRGLSDPQLPTQIVVPPGQSQLLFSRTTPNGSARSTFVRLFSSSEVQVATVALLNQPETPPPSLLPLGHRPSALFSLDSAGSEVPAAKPLPNYRSPTLSDWQTALQKSALAQPRDSMPTPPDAFGSLVYGRVAGVSVGSRWDGRLTDKPGVADLTVPERGAGVSFVLNTVDGGTLGTGQIQSGKLLVRYRDTAYSAHGNYTTHYRLTLPLLNRAKVEQTVVIKLQTPIKEDYPRDGLRFLLPPDPQVFFRGSVRLHYPSDTGELQTKWLHLVQKRGDRGEPLVTLKIAPGARRQVDLDFIYPPDATPPQVLTVESIEPPPEKLPEQPPAIKVIPLIEVPTPGVPPAPTPLPKN